MPGPAVLTDRDVYNIIIYMYTSLNERILKSLASISGTDSLVTSPAEMETYARDETPRAHYMPEAVIKPSSPDQIQEIINLARREKFPVTPRGGGTSLSGGPLPVFGGLVISFERLNRILDIDQANRMAVAEPGLINGVLQSEAEKLGLFYPVNPASMDSCTIGGNVAEATGGANTVRFGTTRNYLAGMEAVTGNGEKWRSGGKVVKNATDQILMQLMCGSEGTLSVFTGLTLRLLPRPAFSAWIIAPFRNLFAIPPAAAEIMSRGMNPTMVELMDSFTLNCCSRYLETPVQYGEFSQLLVRFDSDERGALEKLSLDAGQICLDAGAEDVLVADTAAGQKKIWKLRSSIHEAIGAVAGSVCEEDVVVPVSNVAGLLETAYKISDKYSMPAAVFGHLGDGNIHINFTGDAEESGERIQALREEIFSTASRLGGKLSGEHGIGITKRPYFAKFADSGYLNQLREIKKVFDPSGILNPGKLIP